MIRALIIENEPAPAEHLASLIKENFPDVELLDICETAEAGILLIKKHLPDLAFMDIKLDNNQTAFDIIHKLNNIDFEIIFTTAYDKYAKQAFKVSALDFLEKPIDKDELIDAMVKYKKRKKQAIDPKQIELMLSFYQNPAIPLKMFALPTTKGLTFIEIENIIYCEGASNQTIIHLSGKDNKKEYVNRTLKECEELLPKSIFSRVHKSYLVNLNHIKKYIKGKDGQLLMSNASAIDISRNFKESFLDRFKAK